MSLTKISQYVASRQTNGFSPCRDDEHLKNLDLLKMLGKGTKPTKQNTWWFFMVMNPMVMVQSVKNHKKK